MKFSYWAKCNLMRMDQGGIWLNLIRLVSATLKLNLIGVFFLCRVLSL